MPRSWRNFIWTLVNRVMCPQTVPFRSVPFIYQSVIMGLENEFQELEQDATGQGGNDGDNNANNACALPPPLLATTAHLTPGSNGSNDKTEDTMVDSGMQSHSLHDLQSPSREYKLTTLMQRSTNSPPRKAFQLVSTPR